MIHRVVHDIYDQTSDQQVSKLDLSFLSASSLVANQMLGSLKELDYDRDGLSELVFNEWFDEMKEQLD